MIKTTLIENTKISKSSKKDIKIIKGNYGECIIDDCLNAKGEWELCFTDTLWGKEYNGQKPSGINRKAFKPHIVNYKDTFDPEFHKAWFTKFQNLTKAQVVCTGWKYFNWWVKTFDPIGYHFITFNNGQGMSKTAIHGSTSPYICFGDNFWKKHKFFRGHIQTYITNGFLRTDNYIHPSPKDFKTWLSMISSLNPISVVDPFAGSCPLGEVCEYLGIQWRGYEINPDYIPDIKKRIKKGISAHRYYKPSKKYNQKKLFMEAK